MRMAKSYFDYWRKAKTRHGVHSPFVFSLIEEVFRPKDWSAKDTIKSLRKKMLASSQTLDIEDLGAGSRVMESNQRKVKDIAKISSGTMSQCRKMYRLADKLQYRYMLELGTNLGLTTASLSQVPSCEKIVSIEGDPGLAEIAQQNLNSITNKAQIIQGAFDDKLEEALALLPEVDLAYIDGNHKSTPTLFYFDQISTRCHKESVIIIGDIHWSEDMEYAWDEIKKKSGVRVTIDLFDMGLVFFNPELSKQDFIIKHS